MSKQKKDVEKRWPDDPMLIQVIGGVVDVQERKFISHGIHAHKSVPTGYYFIPANFTGKKSPRWQQFLDEVLPGDEGKIFQRQLQKFFGYCLLRDCRYSKALVLCGSGPCGKSLILNVLIAMLGEDNVMAPCASVSELIQNSFRIIELKNRLAILLQKSLIPTEKDSIAFKQIVSGDSPGHFKYQPDENFYNFAKIVFNTNDMQHSRAQALPSLFSRLVIINFPGILSTEEINTQLSNQIIEQIDGVFTWALHGLYALLDDGGFEDE